MDRTNRNTALASAFVEELARCGVRHATLSPGSRSTPVALALWRQPAIEVTVLVDERCAGFFALGAAQASGTPTAVLCTSGSAAANLYPAVVEADEASVPLIVLTADRPPELRGIGAGQTIDQLKLYGSAVRWFCEVGTHEADDDGLLHYRGTACRAYAVARGESQPGPVHLNLAWREPLAPLPVEGDVSATTPLALEGRRERPLTAVTRSPTVPDSALLDELAERIDDADRPLILAGRQPDPGVADPAVAASVAADMPILAEPTSQLRLGPHDRSTVVAWYDAIARTRPEALAPDLIVRIGDMPTSKPLRQWIASLDDLRQIVIDPTLGWNEPSRRAETIVRADPAATLTGIAERLRGGSGGGWLDLWVSADRAAADAVAAELESIDELTEPRVQLALAGRLDDGDNVFAASSMPIRDQEAFLPAGAARVRFLCNRGANGIDGAVSTAAGAAAATGRRTWAVLGDLALFHDTNGLAAIEELPVRLLVIDNRGGGIFHFLPQAESMSEDEFEALLGTPSGLEVAAAAELHGLDYAAATTPVELDEALAGDAPIVSIEVDRRRNVEVHRRLAEAAAAALSASA